MGALDACIGGYGQLLVRVDVMAHTTGGLTLLHEVS